MAAVITIKDHKTVLKDGKVFGTIAESLANGLTPGQIDAALDAWQAVVATQHADAIKALTDEHATEKTELQSKIDTAQTLIDALGGTDAGKQLAIEKRRAELQKVKDDADAQKVNADAELAKLDAATVAEVREKQTVSSNDVGTVESVLGPIDQK